MTERKIEREGILSFRLTMIDHQQKERLLKVVLCGDGASGKTSLCLRFAHESFNADYHQVRTFIYFFALFIYRIFRLLDWTSSLEESSSRVK